MSARVKVFSLVLLIAITGLIGGCGTIKSWIGSGGPTDTIARTEGVAIPTVNLAMEGWKKWVLTGNATQAQVDKVRAAYKKYEAAQKKLGDATIAYMESKKPADLAAMSNATDAVGKTKGELLIIIASYSK